MLKRVLVGVIGVPLLILVLSFAPSWATMVLVAAMCGVGAHELMHAVAGEKGKRLAPLAAIAAVLVCADIYWTMTAPLPSLDSVLGPDSDTILGLYNMMQEGSVSARPSFLPWIALALVFVLFVLTILHYGKEEAIPFADLMAVLFSGLVFPLMLSCLLRLRLLEFGQILVWMPLSISFGSDTCALFAGMAFGKHKMAPLVSPHKTVEGGIGGLAGGVLGLLLLKWIARALAGVTFLAYWQVLVIGLLCSIVSEIGDLSFSVIKREYGIKDYGKLLPGHGGVLDRFDSVTFTAPLVYCLVLMLAH